MVPARWLGSSGSQINTDVVMWTVFGIVNVYMQYIILYNYTSVLVDENTQFWNT